MTNREFYTKIVESNYDAELTEFAQNALTKMDTAAANRKAKPSKTQIENAPLMDQIEKLLTSTPTTCADLASFTDGLTTAKVSALCQALTKAGRAVQSETKVKGRTVKAYAAAESH